GPRLDVTPARTLSMLRPRTLFPTDGHCGNRLGSGERTPGRIAALKELLMPATRSRTASMRAVTLVSVVVALVATSPARARVAADRRDRIDALLARYQELGLFNGSAMVADAGQVLLRKGYGLANMEWGIANTPDTKFRLGSITKQFTSTLVMQLVEKGQIDL